MIGLLYRLTGGKGEVILGETMVNRIPRRRRRKSTLPNGIRPLEAVLISGIGVLVAVALGATPEKALDYGIQAMKILCARDELKLIEPIEADYQNWLDGLA